MSLKFVLLLLHAASFVVGYSKIRQQNWGHATSPAERHIGITFRLELRLDIVILYLVKEVLFISRQCNCSSQWKWK